MTLAWQDDALCAEVATDMFFPEQHNDQGRNARSVCAECPVREQCLELGMQYDFGIFGGLTPKQRKRARAA